MAAPPDADADGDAEAGAGPDHDHEVSAGVEAGAGAHALGGRRVAAAVAGGLTALYVAWYAVDLIVLGLDPALFNRVHRASDGLIPRLAFAVVAVGVLYHALDGLGRILADGLPRLGRHRVGLDAGARFLTLAAGIPAATAIVWPAVRAWWVG